MKVMIRSIVRPEKADDVMAALMDAAFPAVTKISVAGRGKQRGIKIGEITYDEIPKELLITILSGNALVNVAMAVIAAFLALRICRITGFPESIALPLTPESFMKS